MIDDLEIVKNLLELTLAHLKQDLLLLFKVHLDIEHRLLYTFLGL